MWNEVWNKLKGYFSWHLLITVAFYIAIVSLFASNDTHEIKLRNYKKQVLLLPYQAGVTPRLMNMEKLAGKLADMGLDVNMIIYDGYSNHRLDKRVKTITYPAPNNLDMRTEKSTRDSVLYLTCDIWTMYQTGSTVCKFSKSFLKHGDFPLIKMLRTRMVIADIAQTCETGIIKRINASAVLYTNWNYERSADIAYVSGHYFEWANEFDKGFWHYFFRVLVHLKLIAETNNLRVFYTISNISFYPNAFGHQIVTVEKANSDYNAMQLLYSGIGGFYMQPPKPLSRHSKFDNIYKTARNHEVIVVSLGNECYDECLHKERVVYLDNDNECIKQCIQKELVVAKVLSKLPQQIIWERRGVPTIGVSNNIHIFKWIPHNDLLGHNQTKLFIAACRRESITKAVYHSVPVVTLVFVPNVCREYEQIGVHFDKEEFNPELFNSAIKFALKYNDEYKAKLNETQQRLLQALESPTKGNLFYMTTDFDPINYIDMLGVTRLHYVQSWVATHTIIIVINFITINLVLFITFPLAVHTQQNPKPQEKYLNILSYSVIGTSIIIYIYYIYKLILIFVFLVYIKE